MPLRACRWWCGTVASAQWQMRERWSRGEAWYEEVWIPTLCEALREGVATIVGVAGGAASIADRVGNGGAVTERPRARAGDGGDGGDGGGDGGGSAEEGGEEGGGEGGCVLATLRKLRGVLRGGTTPCAVAPAGGSGGGGSARGARCAWASPPADRFRFRPSWPCDDFVAAVAAEDAGFWHPVKERECWRAYLDSCNASGCAYPRPADS